MFPMPLRSIIPFISGDKMKIGFSKIDVTPPPGTPLCGQLVSLPAKGIESSLYATAMYLDDGMNSVVIVSCDVLMISNEMAEEIGREAAEETGIAAGNIIVCTTHTHSGPYTVDIFGMKMKKDYLESLKTGIVRAIQQAQEASGEGELCIAAGELEGYAFNRRFIMSDGTVETHPLKNDPHIVRAEGPDSKDIFIWCAADLQGELSGIAINYGCHGTVMQRDNDLISSDFPGKIVEYISGKLGSGVSALFLQAPCGNICQVNPLDDSRREVGVEWAGKMGAAIGERAMELFKDSKTAAKGRIRVVNRTVSIPRREINPDLVKWANSPSESPVETPVLSNYGAELYGQIEYPVVSLEELFKTKFWAAFYKNEILTLEKLRSEQPELPLKITVVSQDNWACVTVPCELFIELGNTIRDESPFEYTAVIELANGWNGYIPTPEAFDRKGGYETKEVTSTMLVPDAADILLNVVSEMLHEAYNMK